MTAQTKQVLRELNGQIRKTLSLAQRTTMSMDICAHIYTLPQYRAANHIALYHPIHGEVDLDPVWQCASSQGKTCYFPAIKDENRLLFLPATQKTAWHKKRWGLLEPDVSHDMARSPEHLDIIFLPLVAFDKHGTRVGMGGGYYDRTLATHRPPLLIGVAYEFQHQTFIQADAWDVPMAAVITQQTIYWSKP